jgi:hypothetical protein
MSTPYEYKEYPKSLFRTDADGTRRERLFKSAEEVEPGWTDLAGLPVEPLPLAPPMPSADAVSAGKRLVAMERENAALKDTLKLYEDENKALRTALDAAKAMIPEGEAVPEAPAKASKPKRAPKA